MTKEETAAYNKAYRLANKEKRAAYQKAWYLENKEKRLEQVKANYLENKEKIAEQKKAYYLANKEKKAEQTKSWNKTNPKKRVAYHKAYLLRLNLINKKISRRTLNAWALQVKQRDCYTCRDCGATDKLHAHHIWPKISHPEHALDVVNGTTLCEACHIYEHQTNETRHISK